MNRTGKAVIGAGLAIVAGSAWPAAGQATDSIDEIVVVAHKSERPLREVAASVTVLSRDDLDGALATSMADALRYVPGVDVENAGTRFGTEGINIRGIGGNRVAVLVDGVPLGDQFDVGSFSNATRDFVNAGFVQRVEVLHGPASAIYGSSALGGVVALRSPDPADLSAHGGRLATTWRDADSSWHATALQALTQADAGALLGFSIRDGEGFDSAAVPESPDRREYRRRSALLKFVADDARGNAWQLGYYGQASGVESRLGSMLGTGRFRSTTALEGDDSARLHTLSGVYRFGQPSGRGGEGALRIYVSEADIRQRTLDERGLAARPVAIDRLFEFEQSLRGFELNLHKHRTGRYASHRLAAGVEFRRRHTVEVRDGRETGLDDRLVTNVLLGEVFPLRDFPVSDSTDWGVYVEDAVSIGNWTLIAGLRGDRYELEPVNDPMYAEDYPFADPVSIAVGEVSPKFGFVYRPAAQLDIYLQYAHGFRAPPFEDANIGLELPLFNYRAIPNPDLESERSDGVDLGLRWRAARASARLAVFHSRYEDFIESKVRLGPDPASGRILFQSQNLSSAVIYGVEAGVSFSIVRDGGTLVIDAAAYRARGENRESGEPLNSVGPAQAVVGVDWQPAGAGWHWRLQTTFTDAWSERDESGGESFSPPGHAVFDLYLTRPLGRHARVRAGLTNLTDRTYWSWSDVRGLGPDDPVVPFIARPGRSLVAGLELNW